MDKYFQFIKKHRYRKWYQPVIIKPGILEFRGSWNESTIELAENILATVQNKTILDVGCNVGFFLQESLKKGAKEAVGLDNDPAIISIGTEIANLLNLSIKFHCCDVLRFSSETQFDLILMLNILDFVDSPQVCIKKYLEMGECIIIEHENKHRDLFPRTPDRVERSERAGGRILSIFE